jgi:sugar lactone lactonase YvrE
MKIVFQFFVLGMALWLCGPTVTPANGQELLLITTLTTNWSIIEKPVGVALDGAGNVYGSDMLCSIWKLTPAGVLSTFAGNTTNWGYANGNGANARFSGPTGVALDRAGNLYVADLENHVVRKITPAGVVSTFAGQQGSSGYRDGPKASALFSEPYYIAVDGPGNVYVTDDGNYAIRKIGTNGLVSTLAGSRYYTGYADGVGTNALFYRPNGIAADSAGNVYVADGGFTSGNNVIRKLALDNTGTNWVVSTLAGQAGPGGYADGVGANALFLQPNGVAVDDAGNVYVADEDNNLIRKVTANGMVSTLAGQHIHGTGDGVGTNAFFYGPMSIAVDGTGKVYVGDVGNYALRLGVPYPVPLQVRLSAQQAVLSWPASAAGFVLETSPTASDASWTPITTGIVTVGASCFLTNALTADTAFYRLHHP